MAPTSSEVTTGLCVCFGILIWLSRAALVGPGYGSDPDAWRAIAAATRLLETGHYVPSRPPGYPLPEFADALLIRLGLGSGQAIGMVASVLSGLAASLTLSLYAPLGRSRALAAAVAMSATPVVYIAGFGAMDYIWGLTFFLAASLAAWHRQLWPAATLLGLAAASRPTYALGYLPLAALLLDGDWRQALKPARWPRLLWLALVSGALALLFFLPVLQDNGLRAFRFPGTGWHVQDVLINGTVRLFGLIGVAALAVGLASAVRHGWRDAAPRSRDLSAMDAWAWALLCPQVLLFFAHPDEASYLIPALLGAYWLLARRADHVALWAMSGLLAVSCFALNPARDDQHRLTLRTAGPVLAERQVQARRHCIAKRIHQWMAQHPQDQDLLVVAENRPQLEIELDPPSAGRLRYAVRPDAKGRLQDTEGVPIPQDARITVLDRASGMQAQEWPRADQDWPELVTDDCR